MRVQQNAIVIPRAAITKQQGSYLVGVVGSYDRIAVRPVQVGERIGTMWVIQDGLTAGGAWSSKASKTPGRECWCNRSHSRTVASNR